MLEKTILDKVLARIKRGAVEVTYWDGTSVTYGTGTPELHITIKTPRAVRAMLKNLTLGFGESYMNGLIDIDGPLDEVNRLASENKPNLRLASSMRWVRARNTNIRGKQQSFISHHYDIGNDFYKMWLDTSLTYSCGYFRKPTDSLETAQAQKVAHLLRKLQLKKGMSLLDIGSGWGTLLITAAKDYGIRGMGITLSREQLKYSQAAAKKAGVADRIDFKLLNYQDLAEQDVEFERIISVGMFEHVGKGNHDKYFQAVDDMLVPGGLSVLHSITHDHETPTDPWIDKYIFPGGYVPPIKMVVSKLPNYNFRLLDYENLRLHYAMTLDEWLRRFEAHKKDVLKMYDERFYRMWRLYLASSSAAFRYGDLSLSQFVFSKGLNNDLPLTREHIYKR